MIPLNIHQLTNILYLTDKIAEYYSPLILFLNLNNYYSVKIPKQIPILQPDSVPSANLF